MLTEEQNARIINLFKIYSSEIKPLTYYVERNYFKFPKGLLKEYRDVYDHLARCYEDDATNECIEENLKKAENHFDRIMLDIYKYACDYKRREFTRWKKKYQKYDMERIDNGVFWKDILDKEDEGENVYFTGKKLESKNIKEACSYLKKSFEIYDDIDFLIKDKRELILDTKKRYQAISFGNQIIGFIVGVMASVLASGVWEFIKHFFEK